MPIKKIDPPKRERAKGVKSKTTSNKPTLPNLNNKAGRPKGRKNSPKKPDKVCPELKTPPPKTHGGLRPGSGRPVKKLSTFRKKIVNAIVRGNPVKVACLLAGVAYDTHRRWMQRGYIAIKNKDKSPKEYRFALYVKAIHKAIAQSVNRNVSVIDHAAQMGDIKAAIFNITHGHGKEFYSPAETTKRHIHSGPDGTSIKHVHVGIDLSKCTPEIREKVVAAGKSYLDSLPNEVKKQVLEERKAAQITDNKKEESSNG